MQLAVMIIMAGVVGALIYALLKLRKSNFTQLANRGAQKTRDNFEVLKPCPLCGTMLRRGERVHSVVFSGGAELSRRNGAPPDGASGAGAEAAAAETAPTGSGGGRSRGQTPDYLTHIFGCPYCYPANTEHPRECPVCNRTVPEDGYVIARMFDKPGRKHVHVLGCTLCRGRR